MTTVRKAQGLSVVLVSISCLVIGLPVPQVAASTDPGLVEIGRLKLPRPIVPGTDPTDQRIALVPGEDIAYVLSRTGVLHVFDRAEGRVVSEVLIPGGWADDGANVHVMGSGADRRLLLAARLANFHAYDISDPLHPRELPWSGNGSVRILPLPDGRHAVLVGWYETTILDVITGAEIASLPAQPHYQASVGGPSETPVLAQQRSPDTPFLDTYDLSDPAVPRPLASAWIGRAFDNISVDRSGSLVVVRVGVGHYLPVDFQIIDARSGELLATLPGRYRETRAVLAEGAGERVLALAEPGVLHLFALRDPREPRAIGDVPVDPAVLGRHWNVPQVGLAPLDDRPYLAVASIDPSEVAIIDIRDASVVGRWSTAPAYPMEIALDEHHGGGPRAVVLCGHLLDGEKVLLPGGRAHLEEIKIENIAMPELIQTSGPVVPRPSLITPFDGRYVALWDPGVNAVGVVDASRQKVIATSGTQFNIAQGMGWYDRKLTAAAGRVVATSLEFYEGDERWCGREVLRLGEGRLTSEDLVFHVSDAAITEAGTVITIKGGVETLTLEGVRGVIPGVYGDLDVSPDGKLVLLDETWGGPTVVDISDPATPIVRWSAPEYPNSWWGYSIFVRGGDAIATEFNNDLDFMHESWPVLRDARTGALLGEGEHFVSRWHVMEPQLAVGRGTASVLLFRGDDPEGAATLLYDVGNNTPQLLFDTGEWAYSPHYTPRGDGASWYESGWDRETLMVGSVDGTYQAYGQAPSWNMFLLRRGFLVYRNGSELVFLRDPGLNRTPVADAGPDQILECAGPTGTAAELNGLMSNDLDSAPGTQDDIAVYTWQVDGVSAGTEAVGNVLLDPGHHEAELSVEDRLGVLARDMASVDIVDRLAPRVSLALDPVLEDGRFTQRWVAMSSARDECDGPLAVHGTLVLDASTLAAPVSYQPGSTTLVDVLRDPAGTRVLLSGPDEASMWRIWTEARGAGGFVYPLNDPVVMQLARLRPGNVGSAVAARYLLDAQGRVASAMSYAPGSDHRIRARAVDRADNCSMEEASLRERIAVLCSSLPTNVTCARLP